MICFVLISHQVVKLNLKLILKIVNFIKLRLVAFDSIHSFSLHHNAIHLNSVNLNFHQKHIPRAYKLLWLRMASILIRNNLFDDFGNECKNGRLKCIHEIFSTFFIRQKFNSICKIIRKQNMILVHYTRVISSHAIRKALKGNQTISNHSIIYSTFVYTIFFIPQHIILEPKNYSFILHQLVISIFQSKNRNVGFVDGRWIEVEKCHCTI